MERKLTAILSADVKGYSRLMGEDEEATIRTLTVYREVMTTLIQQHRGRVVDSPGDNLLAESASAVDAVQAAVEIQRELKRRNAELPDARKMEYRIGINVGDVIVEGDRLYGDGINLAARLEGLAEPGGICISSTVYDQVKNKVALGYEYLGEQEVKNIAEPVRVWRVMEEGEEKQKAKVTAPKSPQMRPAYRWMAAGLLLVSMTLVAVRYFSLPLFPFPSPRSTEEAQPPLPLPDKPSIAVLPFTNMSGDPGQEHISDGMTEAVITDLSKLSGLFVIARNSVFTYKGKAVKVNEIGRELGVRYVLEGSVQKAESRVRITAQLVEATTGGHLWAEQYDGEWQDIFALQDELREKIVLALKVKLTAEEQARFRRAPTANLEAYDYYLRGEGYYWRFTREANTQARQMVERAIALDPQYAAAHAFLSAIELTDWLMWDPFQSSLDQILTLAHKAVDLDDSLAAPHSVLGYVYVWKKQYAQAIAEAKRALALDPNYAEGHYALALILNFAGQPEEAIRLMEKAMRLDPAYPAQYLLALGGAYHLTGRYEEAIATFKQALARNPHLFDAHASLALSYGELGREEEARAAVAALLKIQPYASLEGTLGLPYKDRVTIERHLALMRKAGMRWHWPTDNPEALRTLWSGLRYLRLRTKENNTQARQWFERAAVLDPQYAAAHAFLGLTYFFEWAWHWSQNPQTMERAVALAQQAVALDESLPLAHSLLGYAYVWKKQYTQGIAEAERAVALAPDDVDGYGMLTEVLNFAGQSDKALALVEKAMRLNPQYRDAYLGQLGFTYQFLGRYEDAVATLQKVVAHAPDDPGIRLGLAVSYSELGREAEARAEVAELLRINPDYSLELDRQRNPIKDPAVAERFFAALRTAGLK